MLRVSDETHERVRQLGQSEFGGASSDETIRWLLDEHSEAAAVAAVCRDREADPQGWAEYLAAADNLTGADTAITDVWDSR